MVAKVVSRWLPTGTSLFTFSEENVSGVRKCKT